MESKYDLEIDRICNIILEKKYSLVALQLPEGLMPYAKQIVDAIVKKTQAQVYIWAGSNFGACDIPLHIEKLGVDALFHFGHSKWNGPTCC
ncbi:MAG: diphthamide synthesis protein [Candidatus Nanoarchaeia archaeon]